MVPLVLYMLPPCVQLRIFSYFSPAQEFELIEKKELAPLQELIQRLTSINTAPTPTPTGAAPAPAPAPAPAQEQPPSAAGPNSLVVESAAHQA